MKAYANALVCIERLAWICIYGGLFTAVIGLATRDNDPATGWGLIILGGCVAALGAFFIWLRSRMRQNP
ncbi:MAG: hypothetical protein ACAH21_07800 [Ramlibacter sp.]